MARHNVGEAIVVQLPDDEQRQLDEIEQYLERESPWLAEELLRHRVTSISLDIAGAGLAISVGLAAGALPPLVG
ncbi:MAG: DUF3040 domain-containing protein [Actinophytocola sp.]|nr:DUF3040 domain-containing protein [Actinophytocola sp.]